MNKRYKFQLNVHIFGFSGVLFLVIITVIANKFTKSSPIDFLLPICILTCLFGVIINLFSYCSIEKNGIRLKSIIRCVDIEWKDICCIKRQPAGKYVSLSIGVFSKDKKISITPWTKNYKELLKSIVKVCEENENIRIEPIIYNLIND